MEDNWKKQGGYSEEEMGIHAGMMTLKQSETITQKINRIGENRLIRAITFMAFAILGYALLGFALTAFI